jgi:hypothetical protein
MIKWRKSSFSGEDANCVEVAFGAWRKSSFTADSNCVEIAHGAGVAAIRDSKNPDGSYLVVGTDSFRALVAKHR